LINNHNKEIVKVETKRHESGIENESYTTADFEKAWKGFAQTVPEIVSVVSYINNTIPEKINENTYELIFSNVFQESEFKKLLTDLCFSIRKTLRNSSINFITKVVETIEKDNNNNPEEILRKMTEQNPALQVLKKNLNLEID
jgi:DNA polymerase III subunit gamma/tau